MTDYLTMIRKLEVANENPDISEAQKEANEFRIKWLKGIHRDKPVCTSSESTDVIWQRIMHPNYSCAPNRMLIR
ncbi:hypothetical protein [Bacillus toyonensis]|uniref:hypothetical protein n=1 Tax=Bacillus toyonensis TaxID=155322 RepID=UPI00156F1F25|nr:hypothetical protein [Bacillus toyonensis]NSL68293.1 hypothetical protein [Bacillus toyonensis]